MDINLFSVSVMKWLESFTTYNVPTIMPSDLTNLSQCIRNVSYYSYQFYPFLP